MPLQAKEIFGDDTRMMPFGSIVAGLGTNKSDLDLQISLGPEWEATLDRCVHARVLACVCACVRQHVWECEAEPVWERRAVEKEKERGCE